MYYSKKYKKKDKNYFLELKIADIFYLGEHILFENEEYICIESHLKVEKSITYSIITLVKEKEFNIDRIYNEKIRGASILAKVLSVEEFDNKAYLKVDFEIGLENKNRGEQTNGKNHQLIPYKTFYSQNNTGFFPMPEYGDIVDVEFYSNQEKDVKVSWSLENRGSSRFNNNKIRIFKNSSLSIEINDGNLEISGIKNLKLNVDEAYVNLNSGIIKSQKTLALGSDGHISIESIEDMKIYSEKLKINTSNGDIKICSNTDIILKANTIHTN